VRWISRRRLVAVAADQLGRGRLHPHRRQPGGEQLQVVADHVADGQQRLRDAAGAVRRQDHPLEPPGRVVHGQRLVRPHVHTGEEPARGHPLDQRVVVDHRGTADEHQPRARLQQVQLGRPEQVAALLGDGGQHEDEGAARQRLGQRRRLHALLAQHGRRQPRVVHPDVGRKPSSSRSSERPRLPKPTRPTSACRSRTESAVRPVTYCSVPARKARSSRLMPRARSSARPRANSATASAYAGPLPSTRTPRAKAAG
jgi:hypothetical protein